jgi:adenosine deaminase
VPTDDLFSIVHALPKIDLHRHLEGSLRLETLIGIAMEYQITLPSFNAESLRPYVQIMPGEERSWKQFLGKFAVLRQFYRSETIIKRVTQEVIADAAADNIKYMELRFTPQALNNLMRCDYATVVEWVCAATQAASVEHGITVKLILSMNRHESVGIGELVLQAALDHHAAGVVGIDLAGQEDGYSGLPFRDLFEHAKAEGIGVTIHAGEWSGAENVREAVEHLGADRIGHGIRAVEDPYVINLLHERGTVLEVCPKSNLDSGVVPSYEHHPIAALYRSGIKTTINTDDPLVCDITLTDEIVNLIQHGQMTLDDVKAHTLTAASAAFLPDGERAALVAQFRHWLSV